MYLKKIVLSILVVTYTLSLQAQNWWGSKEKIKGNGNVITTERNSTNYSEITVDGSFDVILVKGKQGKISIKGEENIIPYLETEISNNTLKINYKKDTNIQNTKKMTVTVHYSNLESVSLGGSGNISSNDLIKSNQFNVSIGGSGNINLKVDSKDVKASIGGSGNLNLEGNANEFMCSIAGSGNINAYQLIANQVTASIAGSGNIKITVTEKIKSKLVGSGNVYYKGKPSTVNSKSVGSGSTIEKN